MDCRCRQSGEVHQEEGVVRVMSVGASLVVYFVAYQ